MANPVIAGVGLGASVLGAITSAYGAASQGAAQQSMYNYQAGVAQVNAQIAKQDANYTLAAGDVEAQESGMKTGAEVGQTRAGFGASNISGDSQNRVISSEIKVGQENQGIIEANAAKRAYGFSVSAAEDTAQAGAYTAAGANAKTAGDINAVSSIIGGAGQVASKWLQYGPAFGNASSPTQGGMGLYSGAQTGSLY